MTDWRIFAAIAAVGGASYAMRAAGYLAAGVFPEHGLVARLLRLAPGNVFIAFAAVGCVTGEWSSVVGVLASVATMAMLKREWAALAVGTCAAALTLSLGLK